MSWLTRQINSISKGREFWPEIPIYLLFADSSAISNITFPPNVIQVAGSFSLADWLTSCSCQVGYHGLYLFPVKKTTIFNIMLFKNPNNLVVAISESDSLSLLAFFVTLWLNFVSARPHDIFFEGIIESTIII